MVEKKTKEYYDFFDLVKAVDEKLGFDQRDAHKHFGGEYKDFWHYQMDHCFGGNVSNDTLQFLSVSMDDFPIKDKEDWRYKIQLVYNDLFSKIADDCGDIQVWLSW